MTTVTFNRTGGLIANDLDLRVDLAKLPEDEVERLKKLIDDADFFNLPENLAGSASPDEFQYTVRVDNGGDRHSVRTTDTTMPDSLRPLIKELTMMRILH